MHILGHVPAIVQGPAVAIALIGGLLAPILGAPLPILLRLWRRYAGWHASRRRRLRALGIAFAEIRIQRRQLQIRRLQLVIPDAYGSWNDASWKREKAHFCKTRILPLLAARRLRDQWPLVARDLDRRLERAATRGRIAAFDPGMDPGDYEKHCALLLRKAGWAAQVTEPGADQGTDVIARRGKRSMVLQCKLYGRPVGNSAVQQIAAARAHHRADLAAVVSNADFTLRARQLAATNGVYLLHHEQLGAFRSGRPGRRNKAGAG